jgi:hypothetical protein
VRYVNAEALGIALSLEPALGRATLTRISRRSGIRRPTPRQPPVSPAGPGPLTQDQSCTDANRAGILGAVPTAPLASACANRPRKGERGSRNLGEACFYMITCTCGMAIEEGRGQTSEAARSAAYTEWGQHLQGAS